MIDRTNFEVDGLDGTKGSFDLAQDFVTAYRSRRGQTLRVYACTYDINTVERRFGIYSLRISGELETVIPDIKNKVFGDLILVNHLPYANPNLVFTPESALLYENTYFFQFIADPLKGYVGGMTLVGNPEIKSIIADIEHYLIFQPTIFK